MRHKLSYAGIDLQQEVVQAKAWSKKGKTYIKERSILRRGVMLSPVIYLAFATLEDARKANMQNICLCRNEDILLPESNIQELSISEFDKLEGYELRFGESEQSFLVGYNRFKNNEEMYGWIEIVGNPTKVHKYGE